MGIISSEEQILDLIDIFFPLACNNIIIGRGDDCCVFKGDKHMCISSDLFLEDIHFKLKYFPPYSIGYKSLAVNISDILAVGGIPVGFNLSLILPSKTEETLLKGILKGMSDLAHRFNLYLTGGDISRGEKLGINITILGKIEKNILRRAQAKIGELIFITGDIGLARAGLVVLEGGLPPGEYKQAIEQHLTPCVSLEIGEKLRNNPYISSLMDVSDGLARDLPRLLPPHLGARLRIEDSILHQEVKKVAEEIGESPIEFALKGGEDYVFMGTIKKEAAPLLLKEIPHAYIIGEVVKKRGIEVNGSHPRLEGFDHFFNPKIS